jgi:hypothetical protein
MVPIAVTGEEMKFNEIGFDVYGTIYISGIIKIYLNCFLNATTSILF